jgi:hypothetical protein
MSYIQKTLDDGAAQAFILSNQIPDRKVHLIKVSGRMYISSFELERGELVFTLLGGKKITSIK